MLWIMAAVTMTLGNILALLQNNVKRLLAYSSVAHAGYMLMGLATAAAPGSSTVVSRPAASEGVLFYLVAYAAMTLEAPSPSLSYLGTKERPVNQIEDLAGLWKSHLRRRGDDGRVPVQPSRYAVNGRLPGQDVRFSGRPMGLVPKPGNDEAMSQYVLNVSLAFIGMLNAAIGGWYYLRIVAVMFLRRAGRTAARVLSPGRR